jgi:hypothetical protein
MAVLISGNNPTNSYISQIRTGSAPEDLYDLTVAHPLKFHVGQNDSAGVEWNGIDTLDVYIPTIADLVTDPVRFVGTVDAQGNVKDGDNTVTSFSKGDLVYITADCTFQDGSQDGIPCEAGDMAVCTSVSGSTPTWAVIQGENEVRIVATTANNVASVALTGTAQEVLYVEGTTLKLAIDYSDVASKLALVKNSATTIPVVGGNVTVAPLYVSLSQANAGDLDISKSHSIDLPTSLASGLVSIPGTVVTSASYTWNAGAFPAVSKNALTSVSVSTTLSISNTDAANGVYVKSVSAIGSATLSSSTTGGGVTYVTGLTEATGTDFVTGVHSYDSTKDSGKTPAFTVYGGVTIAAANNTFATGFGTDGTTGEVLSSINVGTVTANTTGSDFLTGLAAGTSVVTSVNFGTLGTDSTKSWFLTGLAAGTSVVKSVDFGTVSLATDTGSTFKASAVASASVSNHVLTFSTRDYATPVKVTVTGQSAPTTTFTSAGVKVTGTSAPTTTFTKGGITQAATTVAYKSLVTSSVAYTQSATSYFFDTAKDHNYTASTAKLYITTTSASVEKATPSITGSVTATIPANTFVTALSSNGSLPSLAVTFTSGSLSGSVDTSLSTSVYSWLGVDASRLTGVIPGAYSLETSTDSTVGAVAVGKNGQYDVNESTASVTIAADSFVTGIKVSGTDVA